jgi:SsrA-binding protein
MRQKAGAPISRYAPVPQLILFEMSDIATNRKARRDYHISDKYEAGIELKGTEVKSIRAGKINISESYARVDKGQLWLYNCDIRPYEQASHEFHVPLRNRRLLLHKREIRRLSAVTEQQGLTIVPLRLYWKNRKVKIEIGIGKGKDQRDKRHDLKERAHNREVDRELARFNR